MKSLQVTDFTSPPAYLDIAESSPAAGQVKIKVGACGLNFADLLMMNGSYQETPNPPFTLGLEMAGQVVGLGADVTGFSIGDRVVAFAGAGGLAEYAVVDAQRCVPLPTEISDIQGAGLLVAYGTSHVALKYRARLAAGQRLLVLGASGGVGLTAVELGAAMGADVTACARGAAKLDVARSHGATTTLNTAADDFAGQLKAQGKFDVVYDPVGGDLANLALRRLNPEGQFLTIGFASGDVPKFAGNILLVKNISVHGLYWGGLLQHRPNVVRESIADILELTKQGQISATPHHVLGFDQALDGLQMLRDRTSTGKIVVTVGA